MHSNMRRRFFISYKKNNLDRIYYTSVDNSIVAPYNSDFGASIITNTVVQGTGIIIFDSDVSYIGVYAFLDAALTSITIPNSVTEIWFGAFNGCTSLTRVDITDLSAWCKISFGAIDANPLYNGAKLYLNGSELTDIAIPSDIAEIKDYVFYGCSSLSSITIPDSVTSIGDNAFQNCSSLTSVTIGNGVTSIGDYAFQNCASLPVIDGIRYAGTYLVEVVDKTRTSYTIKQGTRFIGSKAFEECASLKSVTIPDSVTSIGRYVFYNCRSLTSVIIPDGVTAIRESAFYDCASLTNIIIPNSVTSIGSYAFRGCELLTSVIIPDSVTSIGKGAFYSCDDLTSITIPNSVTSIGEYAFDLCRNLTSVYCKAAIPPTLESSTGFYHNASGRKIYVPTASVDAYKAAAEWSTYADYIVGYDFEDVNVGVR